MLEIKKSCEKEEEFSSISQFSFSFLPKKKENENVNVNGNLKNKNDFKIEKEKKNKEISSKQEIFGINLSPLFNLLNIYSYLSQLSSFVHFYKSNRM